MAKKFYQVAFSKNFQRDLKKLDTLTIERVIQQIEKLLQDPFTHSLKLKNVGVGIYRSRIGDYRIRFDIFQNTLQFHTVKHRKDVYK